MSLPIWSLTKLALPLRSNGFISLYFQTTSVESSLDYQFVQREKENQGTKSILRCYQAWTVVSCIVLRYNLEQKKMNCILMALI